jgi:hypothetical protein
VPNKRVQLAREPRTPVPRKLGRAVAVRRLRVPGKPARAVTIRIGTPRRLGGGWDWGCPVEISGLGAPRLRYIFGVDAFQALQLGLDYIAIRTTTAKPRPFLYERDDGGCFTRSLPTYLSLESQERLQALIDKQPDRWTERQKRSRTRRSGGKGKKRM